MIDFKQSLLVLFIIGLVYVLSPMLTPFLLGGLLAYLGDPLVDRLQRFHIPRTIGVLCVFTLVFLFVAGLVLLVFPKVERQIVTLACTVPVAASWLQDYVLNFIKNYINIDSLDIPALQKSLTASLPKVGELTQKLVQAISYSGFAVVGLLINVFLTLVVAFYLMRDWKEVISGVQGLLPRKYVPTVTEVVKGSDTVLGAFFRGQLFVMLSLAVFYAVGLSLVGLNVGFMIGVIAGIVSVVPYLGSIIGLLLAIIAAALQFHALSPMLWVLLVFVLGHLLEGMCLTPWLIGDRIGLHPVAVIFSVLAGGFLFGFFGVLLALPVAAVVRVMLAHAQEYYRQSDIYAE